MPESPQKDRLPVPSTVAAMILAFVYRCGGSVGIIDSNINAPTSRFIPGLSCLRDTCRLADSVGESMEVVNYSETQAFISRLIWVW